MSLLQDLTFRQIRDLKKDYGYGKETSMSDFSDLLNQSTGQNIANAGIGNSFETGVKHYSAGVDDFLDKHAGGVEQKLGDLGASLFGALNPVLGTREEVGRQVGEESLRGFVDFAPLAASMVIPGAAPVGMALTSAMSGANALEKTDSVGHTILASALPFVGGPIASGGARLTHAAVRGSIAKTNLAKALGIHGGSKQVVNKVLPNGVTEAVEQTLAKSVSDRVLGAAGGEAAINTAAMLAGGGVDYNATGEWTNPFTWENTLANLVDPTILFGLHEIARPSVIKEQRVDDIARNNKASSASIEHEAISTIRPDLTGDTVAEIEKQYATLEKQLTSISDRVERRKTKLKLEEAREEAYSNLGTATSDTVSTLFGKKLRTELEPVMKQELGEDDVVKETPVKPEDVLLSEPIRQVETMQELADLIRSEGHIKNDVELGELTQLIQNANGNTDINIAKAIYVGFKQNKLNQTGLSEDGIIRQASIRDAEEPQSFDDLSSFFSDVNVVRSELGKEPLTDSQLNKELEQHIANGKELSEAQELIFQHQKNEAVALVDSKINTVSVEQLPGVERSALLGATRGGRPERALNKNEQQQLNWIEARRADALPEVELTQQREQELTLFDHYLTKPFTREQKPRTNVELAKIYRQWSDDQEAGFLTKDGKKQEELSPEEQLDILETRLKEKWKNSGKELILKSVRASDESRQNAKFDTDQEAKDYAKALEKSGVKSGDKVYRVKTVVRKSRGKHIVRWRPYEGGFEAFPELLDHIIADKPSKPEDVHDTRAIESKEDVIAEVIEGMAEDVILLNSDNLAPEEMSALNMTPEEQIKRKDYNSITNEQGDIIDLSTGKGAIQGDLVELQFLGNREIEFVINDLESEGVETFHLELEDGNMMDLTIEVSDGRAYMISNHEVGGIRHTKTLVNKAISEMRDYIDTDPTQAAEVINSTLQALDESNPNRPLTDEFGFKIDEEGNPIAGEERDIFDLDLGPEERPQFGGGESAIEVFQQGVSPRAVFNKMLSKSGMTDEAIRTVQPTVERLVDIFNADDVTFFEIIKGDVRGAASMGESLRAVFLSDKGLEGLSDRDKVDALNYVVGHELAHTVEQLHQNGQLSDRMTKRFGEFIKGIDEASVDDRRLMLEMMSEAMPRHLRTSEVVMLSKTNVEDPKEVRANLLSMWSMSRLSPPDSFLYKIMPISMRKGLEVLHGVSKDIVGALKGTTNVFSGFMSRQQTRAQLKEMVSMSEQFQSMHKEAKEFEAEARKLTTMGEPFRSETLAYFSDSVLPDDRRSKITKAFDETIMTFDQLAAMSPTLAGVNRVLHDYSSGTRASVNQSVGILTGAVDSSGKATFTAEGSRDQSYHNGKPLKQTDWERVGNTPKLNQLANEWMLRHNDTAWTDENGGSHIGKKLNFQELKEHDPALFKKLMKLHKTDRNAIVQVVHRTGEMMRDFSQNQVMKAMVSGDSAILKATIANKHPELWAEAPDIVNQFQQAVTGLNKAGDPQALAEVETARHILSQLATRLDTNTFRELFDIATKQNQERGVLLQNFKQNEHFFSEIRQGKYGLRWTEHNGESGYWASDDLKQAQRKEAELNARGINPSSDTTRRGVPRLTKDDQITVALKAYDEKNKKFVDQLGLSAEYSDKLKSMLDYGSMIEREMASESIIKTGSDRKLAKGREELNMVSTQIAYINAATRSLHRRIFDSELQYQLTNPEMNDPKVQAHMPTVMSYIENFLTPDTQAGTFIQKANFVTYLGGNVSNHLLEIAQPAFTFMPEIQAQGYSFTESMKMIHTAQEAVGKNSIINLPSRMRKLGRTINKKSAQGKDLIEAWDKPEYQELMQVATDRDAISASHASDVIDIDVSSNLDLSRISGTNGKTRSLADKAVSPVRQAAQLSMKFYQQFTEHNARVSLIIGYEMARNKGMSHSEAIESAIPFSRTVTFSGGKAGRSNLPYSNKGHFRTAGQALMSLSGFTFNSLSMMRRYAETGYSKRQFPHLTEQQRKDARRALRTMVSTQFVGAGLRGLPFIGAAMALFQQMTGIDMEKEMQDGLDELLQQDKSLDGGFLTDVAMSGAANAILGKVMPGAPDVGSRFAIGGVLGVNSYDGFSASAFAGPTGSLISSVADGATSLLKDRDPSQALEDIAPLAWRKPIEMLRNSGDFRDDSGGLLVDSTLGEKFSYAVGFVPQKVRKLKTYERLLRDQERRSREKDVKFYDQLAEQYYHNPLRVMNELKDKAENDPKVEFLKANGFIEEAQEVVQKKMREGGLKIAERVEKREFARDPMKSGTFNSSTALKKTAHTMLQNKQTSQEVGRLETKHHVMTALGLDSGVNNNTYARAILIDQLRSQNPRLPYSQAAVLADQHLKRNPALKSALGL